MTTPDTNVWPVQFGKISIGDGTARLAVKIKRVYAPVDALEYQLCGTRVTVTMEITDGQPTLPGAPGLKLEADADSATLSLKPEWATAGLTFSREDVNIDAICGFADKLGELTIRRIKETELPEEPEPEEPDD